MELESGCRPARMGTSSQLPPTSGLLGDWTAARVHGSVTIQGLGGKAKELRMALRGSQMATAKSSLGRDGDGSLEHGRQGSAQKFGNLCVLWRGRNGAARGRVCATRSVAEARAVASFDSLVL